jgi:nucleoid DNA-binding protein
MSKILIKAQQQPVFNLNGTGTTDLAYVLRPVRYTTMDAEDIVNYCAANSVVPKTYLSASMVAIAQCIENFLLNGHSVEFPNLGIFSLTSSGISEADINKVGIEQLHKLNVRFLPCTKLKAEVEAVTLEFDGIYDIAGEVIVGDRGDGAPKSYKYYKKVRRGQMGVSGSSTEPGPSTGSVPSTSSGAFRSGLVETDSEDEA